MPYHKYYPGYAIDGGEGQGKVERKRDHVRGGRDGGGGGGVDGRGGLQGTVGDGMVGGVDGGEGEGDGWAGIHLLTQTLPGLQ